PSGCFEQTSSSTYPNLLVLDYLRNTGEASDEVEATATEYIAMGYQRLMSYEVSGGGFSWFGDAPAHRILTAYGLLEFNDMAKVYPIDPAIIPRTQQWLLSQQESDGRWRAAPEGIQEGATNAFTDSDFRATAYVTYALVESGERSSATMRGADWVREMVGTIEDPYSLALAANLLIALDPADALASDVLDRLEAQVTVVEGEEPMAHWVSESNSLYYATGDSMSMETTALVLQALIRADRSRALIDQTVSWLISKRNNFGIFSSTQATILTLRAFHELSKQGAAAVDGTVTVSVDGEVIQTLEITPETADLMRLVDVSPYLGPGTAQVEIALSGEGTLMMQLGGEYYLPWPSDMGNAPLVLDVRCDTESMAVGDVTTLEAVVSNPTDARH